MKRTLVLIVLALSCTHVLYAQQTGMNNGSTGTTSYTISMQSNLVVELVTVKDKQGQFIHGLTAKDFILSEDDKPQVIRHCEYQNLAETSKPLASLTADEDKSTIFKKLSRTQVVPESENNAR